MDFISKNILVLIVVLILIVSAITTLAADDEDDLGESEAGNVDDISQTSTTEGSEAKTGEYKEPTEVIDSSRTATAQGDYSIDFENLYLQLAQQFEDTNTNVEGSNLYDLNARRDSTSFEARSFDVFRGSDEVKLGETFELNQGNNLNFGFVNNEYLLSSSSGEAARIGQTFVTDYTDMLANLNKKTLSLGSISAADDKLTPNRELSFQRTSAILFNNGEIAYRQLGPTTARTDSNGKLTYLKTSSTTDDNVMVIPGATTVAKLENIDAGKEVEVDFQGSQTKLTLGKDIKGNINNLITFKTLDYNAIVNSYKIGKQITVTTSDTELDFTTFNFVETFTSDARSKIVYNDEDGIEYLEAAKGSKYTYSDRTKPEKSFTLDFNQDFKLRIRKSVAEPEYADVDGLIDFVDRKIVLKGKATYTRGTVTYSSDDNIAVFSMDSNFDIIEELRLDNASAELTAGPFKIREQTKRYLYLPGIRQNIKNYLARYSSPSAPDIEFQNRLLIQDKIKIFAKDNPNIPNILQEFSTEKYEKYK
ncbi:hypothetical protein KY337_05225 [Candidatus Woesearchaeota archaeon]|nr:hypothetical protein [Candidatus Woesearchaeota archaeon]